MNKLVDKRVRINLYPHKATAFVLFAFETAAKEQNWTDTEIALALSQTKGLSKDGQFEVLLQYCLTYSDDFDITQEDVEYMLCHLGCHFHYLRFKEINTWDEYDWGNYNSLKRKATSAVRKVYGLFTEAVEENDKYSVTSPPKTYFDTLEQAKANIPVGRESSTRIYSLWIKN